MCWIKWYFVSAKAILLNEAKLGVIDVIISCQLGKWIQWNDFKPFNQSHILTARLSSRALYIYIDNHFPYSVWLPESSLHLQTLILHTAMYYYDRGFTYCKERNLSSGTVVMRLFKSLSSFFLLFLSHINSSLLPHLVPCRSVSTFISILILHGLLDFVVFTVDTETWLRYEMRWDVHWSHWRMMEWWINVNSFYSPFLSIFYSRVGSMIVQDSLGISKDIFVAFSFKVQLWG